MAQIAMMKNKLTGEIKEAPLGFSWTTLLFGVFVPLIRGDFKWFVIFLILAFITAGLVWFVVPFIYNKIYVKELISKGFRPADDMSKNLLRSRGIYVPDENE
jgi:hypothetical protein